MFNYGEGLAVRERPDLRAAFSSLWFDAKINVSHFQSVKRKSILHRASGQPGYEVFCFPLNALRTFYGDQIKIDPINFCMDSLADFYRYSKAKHLQWHCLYLMINAVK